MISNSNVDNALVFEDDAVISDVKQFVAEINKLSEVKVDKFINLVNVVSIENLCVNKLITERISSELYLGKPITNGLCAYFLNRSFASSMLNERLMNKNFDYLPCDFAFNELFLRLSSYKKISESSFYSKLYLNPLVEHGSQSLFKDNSVSSILNDKPK
jgi:GR25 family glycosyltransferase involved in LPS biosynthesis